MIRVCQECRREVDNQDNSKGPLVERSESESTTICRPCNIRMFSTTCVWLVFHVDNDAPRVLDLEDTADELVKTGRWKNKVRAWVE